MMGALKIRRAAAALALGAAFAAPAVPAAAAAPHAYVLSVRETQGLDPRTAGVATLRLLIYDDGTVRGTFSADNTGRPAQIEGGLDGKRIWLNIPGSHLTGEFADGKLTAYGHERGDSNRADQSLITYYGTQVGS